MSELLTKIKAILDQLGLTTMSRTVWLEILAGLAIVGGAAILLTSSINRDYELTPEGFKYIHPEIITDMMISAEGYYGSFSILDMSVVKKNAGNASVLHKQAKAFALAGGSVLFYNPYINTAGLAEAQFLMWEPKTQQLTELNNLETYKLGMGSPMPFPVPVLISDNTLLMVGLKSEPEYRPNSIVSVWTYNFKTGQTTAPRYTGESLPLSGGSLFSDSYPEPPFVAGVKGEGAMIGTYRLEENTGARQAQGLPIVIPVAYWYDAGSNTWGPAKDGVELPVGYSTAQIEIPGRKALFLYNDKLYEINGADATTKFLRNVDVDEYAKFGDMYKINDSLIWINGSTVGKYVNESSRIYLYDISTNQLYYRRLGDIPLVQIHDSQQFEEVIESGDILDPHDTNIFTESTMSARYLVAPTTSGTMLVVSLGSKYMPWNFGLFGVKDFTWIKPLEDTAPDSATNYLNFYGDIHLGQIADDSITTTNGDVIFFSASEKNNLPWVIYHPNPKRSTDQIEIAQKINQNLLLPSTNTKTRGIWQKAKGKLELYNQTKYTVYRALGTYTDEDLNTTDPALEGVGKAYALPDNRVLFVKPITQPTYVGGKRVKLLVDGTFGQIYNPKTGESTLLKFPSLVGQEVAYDYAVVDTIGQVHFFFLKLKEQKILVIDTRGPSASWRDLEYEGGGGVITPWLHSWADASDLVAVPVGNEIVFYSPTSLAVYLSDPLIPGSPDRYPLRTYADIRVYNIQSSTFYNVFEEEAIRRFGAEQGLTIDQQRELEKDLPIFSVSLKRTIVIGNPFFPSIPLFPDQPQNNNNITTHISSAGLAVDKDTILMVLNQEIKLFNFKEITTQHLGTTQTVFSPLYLFIESNGNPVIIGTGTIETQEGDRTSTSSRRIIERFDIESQTSQVWPTFPAYTTADLGNPFMLYGDRIFAQDGFGNYLIYDLNTNREYWAAQPFYLSDKTIVQLADGSLLLYGKVEYSEDKEDPVYYNLPSHPDIQPGELQLFVP